MKRWHPGGFSLIELLVSLGILAIISIAFATILSQSQRVVAQSNAVMRTNNTAAVICQLLRDDIRALSKDGYLRLLQDPNGSYLEFTALGPRRSMTYQPDPADPVAPAEIWSNSATIAYGLTPDHQLYRGAFLHVSGAPPASGDAPGDDLVYDRWLTCFWTPDLNDPLRPRAENERHILWGPDGRPSFPLPLRNPADVATIWCLVAEECTQFDVTYWNPVPGAWESAPGLWGIEAGLEPPWGWPPMIRVSFALALGRQEHGITYEVICSPVMN